MSRLFTRLLPGLLLTTLLLLPSSIRAEDAAGPRPLRATSLSTVHSILPAGTRVLIKRSAIEAFLTALEGSPPDWPTVYGHGHHDPGHDERLFNLNRERDAAREGKAVLNRPVAFVWSGKLSQFDPETKSYAVAVGPEFIATSWGLIRFKPEEFPNNLRVKPEKPFAGRISRRLARHETVEVLVVMAGVLIPSESVIYDFSHDQEGVGLIMPVVRVGQVEVFLKRPAR